MLRADGLLDRADRIPFVECEDGMQFARDFFVDETWAARARAWLADSLARAGAREEKVADAIAAAGEAFVRVFERGHQASEDPAHVRVLCYCCFRHRAIVVQVASDGGPFGAQDLAFERRFGWRIVNSLADATHLDRAAGSAVTLFFAPMA